jgi:Ti-type conjugative transfer relaxase TraA
MEIVMAIYHFSAKVISRANGSSALASAAYRSASRLFDQRLDRSHDFTNKSGVIHSEVMTPQDAPDQLRERENLWNAVESAEKRKDAQLAREVEFAIPRELDKAQGIELARDFVQTEFVGPGMIADLNIHWDIGADGQAKPHAHVMLTMRSVDENGFGAKVREWNRAELLEHWREAWASHVNERLAELGIEARIDHRSFEAQGIGLEPQHKIGPAAARMAGEGLEPDRLEEHREIARENGARIIADPKVALDAITRQQATFTRRDLAMFVHRHSDGLEQFNAVMGAVERSPELVRLGRDGRGQDRFTSREMIAVEERLHRAAEIMSERERHRVRGDHAKRAPELAGERGLVLSREQRSAFAHVTEGHDLAIVVGYAGSGKSAMLGVAREAWQESGYQVRGLAISGIAAENLETGSGIVSRTIASMEHQWGQGRELLSDKDVLVIDEAGMIGSRQLERVLGEAQRVGAKVVLVGDPEQLQAIEAGATFRSLVERHPHAEVRDIRRQQEGWQQDATRHLATGRTGEALEAYREHSMVRPAQTRDEARADLVEGWDRDRTAAPDKTRVILTHTNDEVAVLNNLARAKLRDGQELGLDVEIRVERGDRTFASGDRVIFLKNDRGLGIKNGSLGEVETVTAKDMTVRLDTGRSVAFDLKDYAHLDHGYAATIHKAQGVTVDQMHVLATPGLDRHSTYVALSRHRDCVQLYYGRDDFADDAKLVRVLSRERAKDMAGDYERELAPAPNRSPDRAGEARSAAASPERVGQAPAAPKRGLEWGGESDRAAPPTPRTPSVPQRAARTEPPKPGRSIFAGFKSKTPTRVPGPEEGWAAGSANAPGKAPAIGDIRLGPAVQRYARALNEITQARASGNPELPHQREAWVKANRALDAIRPHAASDLDSAFAEQPSLIREAIAGRPQRAIQAMQVEAEIRVNPALRADRFVARWQDLDRQRMELYRSGDWQAERTIKATMGAMGKSLERDPQVESLLRNRVRELGVPMDMARGVGASIIEHLGLGRGRGLGL